jgi:membrane-bound serine protease (ClpP class)
MIPLLLILLVLWVFPAGAATVPIIEVEGPIGPVSAEYVSDALQEAATDVSPLVVLRIDTPGGLDASMRRIVRSILNSPVPVVAWVGPSGARAASAGLFLVAAAQVAAMAPGTNLGAAHPVAIGMGGGGDETMAKKAEEDAAAYVRSLAEQRGRDPEWFEQAVVESRSISADEALEKGVVDLVVRDLNELFTALDGRTVEAGGRKIQLDTGAFYAKPVPWSLRQKVLKVLSDPNVAYLLLLLGFYGLFFELSNPGTIFPGVLGGLCLILAFVGLQTLPFSYAGVLLVLLGLVLLLLEIKIVSFGLLTVGGVVSLTLGSLMLFKTTEAYHRLSFGVVLPAVGATVAFFVFAVGKGIAAQRVKPVSGTHGLVGERARVIEPVGPDGGGKVFVHGEYWNARAETEVPVGTEVQVLGVEGMELRVGSLESGRRI